MVQLLTSWHLFFQFYVLAFFVNHIEKENIYLDCFSSMLLKISPNITVFRSKSTTVPRDDPFFFFLFLSFTTFWIRRADRGNMRAGEGTGIITEIIKWCRE